MKLARSYFTKSVLVLAIVVIATGTGVLMHSTVFAAPGINRQINFQGKLVNGASAANPDTNVADSTYSVVFTLYDTTSGGTALWTETQSVTTEDGIFRVSLGAVTSFPANFNFNWDGLYLGIKVGADSEMTPRIRLAAVPFAFNSEKVAGLTVTDENDVASTSGTLKVPNGATISFGSSFTTTAGNALTLSTSGTTNVTLPTGGTLATLAGLEILTNKSIGSTGLTFSGATTDVTTGTNEDFVVLPNGSGKISFNTTTPRASFDVRANMVDGGTTAVASMSGTTSFAAVVANSDSTTGDIFTASASGKERFTLTNAGGIRLDGSLGTASQCITGGTTASWGVCGSGTGNDYWALNASNGTLALGNQTLDLLVGGATTASAKFGFLNVAGNTPTASISGTSNSNALSLLGNGSIQTQNANTLTLGGSTTGDINLSINSGNNLRINGTAGSTIVSASCVTTINGIVTGSSTCPGGDGSNWDILSGAVSPKYASTVDFLLGSKATSSAKFAVTNINSGTPVASLSAGSSGGAYLSANGILQTTARQTLSLGGTTTGLINVLNSSGTVFTTFDTITSTLLLGANGSINGALTFLSSGGGGAPTIAADSSSNLNISAPGTVNIGSGTGDIQIVPGANNVLVNLESTGDFLVQQNGINFATFNNLGEFGFGTTSPLASFDVRANLLSSGGTLAVASVSGRTSFATLLANNDLTTGDIFTASASGQERFTVTNAGGIRLGGSLGTATQCITGGTTASWGVCGSGTGNDYWALNASNGTLALGNQTLDLLVGGSSTASAKFAIVNVAGGTPTASVSAGTAGGAYLSANGGIATTNKQSLTLGGTTTGFITILSSLGTAYTTFDTINQRIGLGTTSPVANLDIRGTSGTLAVASISGNTRAAALVVDTINGVTGGDIFTASASGQERFSLTNAGGLRINGSLGSSSQCLKGGTEAAWGSCGGGGTGNDYWLLHSANGTLSAGNQTLDLLLGSTATATAKFGFLNVAGNTPTASISANSGANALSLTGTGVIATTNKQTLTLGGASTGLINVLNTSGTVFTTFDTVNSQLLLGLSGSINGALTFFSSGGGTAPSISADASSNLTITAPAGTVNVGSGTGDIQILPGANNVLVNLASTGDFFIQDNGTNYAIFDDSRKIGFGTTSPLASFDVRSNAISGGTLAVASVSGRTSFATLLANNDLTTGDIFTASASGLERFTITNSGGLRLGGSVGSSSQCLKGGTEAAWGSCGSGSTGNDYWVLNASNGTLSVGNQTLDTLFGGTSTASAAFRLTGNTLRQGTSPAASVSARTSYAAFAIDNRSTVGDLFTASASGLARFVIKNNGNVGIGTTLPSARLAVNGTVNAAYNTTSADSAFNSVFNFQRNDAFADAEQTAMFVKNVQTSGGGSSTVINGILGTFDITGGSVPDHGVGVLGIANVNTGWTSPTNLFGTEGRAMANTNGDMTHGIYGLAIAQNAVSNANTILYGTQGRVSVDAGPGTVLAAYAGEFTIASTVTGCAVPKLCAYAVFGDGSNNYYTIWYGQAAKTLGDDTKAQAAFNFNQAANKFIMDLTDLENEKGMRFSLKDATGSANFDITNRNSVPVFTLDTAGRLLVGQGTVGVAPFATLDVRGNLINGGTIAVASASGNTAFAALIANNNNTIGDIFSASSSGQNRFVIRNNGNVGIGSSAVATIPRWKLTVSDSQTATATALIENTAANTAVAAGSCANGCHTGLNIRLGAAGSNTAAGAVDRFINFQRGDGLTLGKIRGANGTNPGIAFDTGAGDYAEWYKKAYTSEEFNFGDVVCLTRGGITKCDAQNKEALGVVTDNPGFIGNSIYENDPNYVLIGIVGQIRAKVSLERGVIHSGDYLSYSQSSGVVAKAIASGSIIGRALEDYTTVSGDERIWVAVQQGYIGSESTGLALETVPTSDALGVLADLDTATKAATITQITADRVVAGLDVIAPRVVSKEVAVDTIRPVGSSIALNLDTNGQFIVADKSGKPAITFDSFGNATFSGMLTAAAIKAGSIEGLDVLLGDLRGFGATPSAQTEVLSALSNRIDTLESRIASLDATMTSTIEANTISQTLMLSQTTIATSTSSFAPLPGLSSTSSELHVRGNGLIEGMLSIIDTITTQNIVVNGLASFFGDVVLQGNVRFVGRPTFNHDSAGFAVIRKGKDSVSISFDKEYENDPVVTAAMSGQKLTAESYKTAVSEGDCTIKQDKKDVVLPLDDCSEKLTQELLANPPIYVITNKTTKGFTIRLAKTTDQDMSFSWVAVAVTDAKTEESPRERIVRKNYVQQ